MCILRHSLFSYLYVQLFHALVADEPAAAAPVVRAVTIKGHVPKILQPETRK